jgi:hypothetical protein
MRVRLELSNEGPELGLDENSLRGKREETVEIIGLDISVATE